MKGSFPGAFFAHDKKKRTQTDKVVSLIEVVNERRENLPVIVCIIGKSSESFNRPTSFYYFTFCIEKLIW